MRCDQCILNVDENIHEYRLNIKRVLFRNLKKTFKKVVTTMFQTIFTTRNARQSLAYSPLGVVVSPPSEYL